VLLYAATGFFGPDLWDWNIKTMLHLDALPAIGSHVPAFSLHDTLIPVALFGAFGSALASFYYVWDSLHNLKKFVGALAQWTPVLVSFRLSLLWFHAQPALWITYPRWCMLTLGVGFAEMTCELILRHVCGNERVPLLMRPHIPLVIGALNAALSLLPADPYRPFGFGAGVALIPAEWALVIFVALTYSSFAHWVYNVIDEICTALGIRCLVIPPEKYYAPTPAK